MPVKIVRRFERVSRLVGRLAPVGNGPIRDAVHQWRQVPKFPPQRFDKVAKVVAWPDLKESQAPAAQRPARRREPDGEEPQERSTGYSIMRDTGTLLGALILPSPQARTTPRRTSIGVRVGFGGPAKHPEGKTTIAAIAAAHQAGAGNLPVRKIIVPPDEQTKAAMAGDMQRAVDKIVRATDRK